jgi:hypothetical protein
MANQDEIQIHPEAAPRFKLQDELGGGTRLFTLEHSPQYGLLATKNPALLIPGLAFASFNKSSLPDMKMLRENDLIQVSCDPDTDIYRAWDPPEEYQVQKGYNQMFKVKLLKMDAMDYPMIVAEPAL